jgi:16S rRNA (uracil1498-N3)-methyltransferase
MPAPRLLVPSITAADRLVSLSAADAHHLARVLRATIGDEVRVFDGHGREWLGRLSSISGSAASVEIVHEATPAPEPHVRLTLAVGLLKGEQMDRVVRDATMLGAFAIVPMSTTHVAVPPKAWKGTAVIERWRRVAIASAKQCGRAVVPDVSAVTSFADVLRSAPDIPKYMCVEPSLSADGLETVGAGHPRPRTALALIGPEGGWSAAEVEQARASGATLVSLGPRTLRADTAPTVVLTALWSAWGW